MDIETGNRVAV